MTSSEEVQKLLDERGIKYTIDDSEDYKAIEWQGPYNLWWQFVYNPYDEEPYGVIRLMDVGAATHITPAQAIAATLGNVGYGMCFAPTFDRPPETMVGETVFDSEGNAIGWIVAATVGRETLTAEQVRECAKGVYFEGYSDGTTHRVNGIEETDWQTIADKLNATLGEGTCHYIPDDTGFTWWDENDEEHYEGGSASYECGSASCDKCGYEMMVGDDGWFNGWDEITEWWEEDGSYHKGYVLTPRFKHCPNCGRRVMGA